MFNKLAIAAVVAAIGMPVFAGNLNGGKEMEARLLGLSPAEFTTSELGQISAETKAEDRRARADYIQSQGTDGYTNAVAVDAVTPRGRDF